VTVDGIFVSGDIPFSKQLSNQSLKSDFKLSMSGQRRESPTITPSFSGFIFLNPDSHLWEVSLKTEIDSPID
jgi:hypothetical protein